MVPLQDPAALHAVALVEVQLKFAEAPALIVVDDAFNVTTGAGAGLPPPPPPPPQADVKTTGAAIKSQEIKRTDSPR
jgi:hypothetical protein